MCRAAWVGILLLLTPLLGISDEPSGAAWVKKFPTSTKMEDLADGFREKVVAFKKAVEDAGAKTNVLATVRPKERAYLMHWAWKIVKEGTDAQKIPAMKDIDINWWHGTQKESVLKAKEMVDAYGIGNLGVPPALNSRHIQGNAIDMIVTWEGKLLVKNKSNVLVEISTLPRDSTNSKLIEVGASYGVIHFINASKDKNHWSTDGR